MPGLVSIAERISDIAASSPDELAVVEAASSGRIQTLSWRELDELANSYSRGLASYDVTVGSCVAVALSRGIACVATTLAAWKLGATVIPLDPSAPREEFERLSAQLGDAIVVGEVPWSSVEPSSWTDLPGSPVPAVGTPRSAALSGGTTGLPRIVLRAKPWLYALENPLSPGDASMGLRLRQVQLVILPLHHAGFANLFHGLALAHTVVLPESFTPAGTAALIRDWKVNVVKLVPTMMRMMLDDPRVDEWDLSSLEAVHHSSAPCPENVKRGWIDLVGAERIWEIYSSVERLGQFACRGDKWLSRPGTVGLPLNCDVRILDDHRRDIPPNAIGEIFIHSDRSAQPTYLGEGVALREHDGFLSVGDLGWIDEAGYLYLAGRSDQAINVGGKKVHPREVENVLLSHPQVEDAVVFGKPHPYLGQRVHADVLWRGREERRTRIERLSTHCLKGLAPDKSPMSWRFVEAIERTEAGKLRLGGR